MEVVLPLPLTPTIRITVGQGGFRQWRSRAFETPQQHRAQESRDLCYFGDLAAGVGRLQFFDEARAKRAKVRLIEHVLQLVEKRRVELASEREQPRQAPSQDLARLLECRAQLAKHHACLASGVFSLLLYRAFLLDVQAHPVRIPLINPPELAVENFCPARLPH